MKRKLMFASLIFMLLTTAAFGQKGYPKHTLQVVNENGKTVTDVTSIKICSPNTTTAQTIYMEGLLTNAVTNPITTVSSNTTLTQASGSCYWYGPDAYDAVIISTVFGTITYKGLNNSISRIVFPSYWQASQTQTSTDAQSFTLGTDADWVIAAGATADRFTATPATDGAVFWVGNATRQADFKWWAGTGSTYANFSQSGSEIDFVGLITEWDDASYAKFGTDSDWSVYSSTAKQLDIVPTVTDESPIINLGANTVGAVVNFYPTTTGDYVKWNPVSEFMEFLDTGISLGDGDPILFGDTVGTGDFLLAATANVLALTQVVADTGTVTVGADGTDIPTKWFAETAGDYFEISGDTVNVEDMTLSLGDGTKLLLGDPLGTGDFSVSSTTNVLTIAQVVADTGTIVVGADGAGIDVTLYGEEAGDYLKWDATGASKLILNGADSSGTLFGITGIDTTGNTDTMTIAHSGTGDGLQITCSTATAVAENLVAAASQTTSVLKVDGTTGSWLGAANVGMVNLTNDGALANVASSLLYIANTGVPQNDSRGSSLRIVDTGNAAAGTAGYAVYVSATDATVEALYIDDGKVLVDETITSGGGVQSLAVTVAADTEATQVTIPTGTRFVNATSAGATNVICLPVAVVGNMIDITCAATGCELQTIAASNATINGVDCDGTNELAIAAGKIYHLECVAAGTWIAWAHGADGAAEATLVPDAD